MRLSAALAGALAVLPLARAGYITVDVETPRQCMNSTVQWSGDDGPYHLLLTPVWIPSIPNGTNSYSLDIGQPAGMQFMVTVWGASGIEYAGTTDVMTSPDKTCFLSDVAINKLYTFAFNISNSNNGFPPQCSNLTMSWPTSLESEITMDRRGIEEGPEAEKNGRFTHMIQRDVTPMAQIDEDQSSSNQTSLNTTVPPTMFGIIPLGNSFSIPITYPINSKVSKGLPASSVSKHPTTETFQGVTKLNWPINLAKGTRFIVVAGIGSQEEWASGGSSEMMTVGQGGSGCFYNNEDDLPKVTAYSSKAPSPTGSTAAKPGIQSSNKSVGVVGIIMACVFSVLGTAVILGILWFCCRVRHKRTRASEEGRPKPSVLNIASFGRLDRKHGSKRVTAHRDANTETQLDLISGFDESSEYNTPPHSASSRRPLGILTSPTNRPNSAVTSIESDRYRDGFERPYAYTIHGSIGGSRPSTLHEDGMYPPRPVTMHDEASYPGGRRAYTMYDEGVYPPYAYQSPTSPLASPMHRDQSFERTHDLVGRQPSIDGLVSYPPLVHTSNSSSNLANLNSESSVGPRARGALFIHDPTTLDSDDDEAVQLQDLKRETLAVLDSQPSSPKSPVASGSSGPSPVTPAVGPSRRRRRTQDPAETEYVVHRDAGRIAGGASRRVELPPRYEELDWNTDTQADPDLIARITTPPPVSASPASPARPLPPSPMGPPRSRTADSHPNPHPLPVPPVPQDTTPQGSTHSRQTTM